MTVNKGYMFLSHLTHKSTVHILLRMCGGGLCDSGKGLNMHVHTLIRDQQTSCSLETKVKDTQSN